MSEYIDLVNASPADYDREQMVLLDIVQNIREDLQRGKDRYQILNELVTSGQLHLREDPNMVVSNIVFLSLAMTMLAERGVR